jgi:uncharacterized protein YjiK
MKLNIEIEDNVELQTINRGKFLDADTIAKLKSMKIDQSFVVSKVHRLLPYKCGVEGLAKDLFQEKFILVQEKTKTFTLEFG